MIRKLALEKVMPSTFNLFDHWGGKRLSQLLALFSAIALTPSMLLAQDWDHLNGRDKVNDPTGACAGSIQIDLRVLPPKITAPRRAIPSYQDFVEIPLDAAADAPVRTERSVFADAS